MLPKVAEELKEPDIPWQIALADTTKHPQIGLEQGEQTLRSILLDLSPCICLLRVIDLGMPIALQRPIPAGRVRIQPPARVDGSVRRLLHRLHGEIAGRLDDDCPLATAPRNNGRPIFVIMAPARLALLTAPPCPAA